MSDDSYTEQQARLDVYEFIAKTPNALNLGKSELVAEIESFKHEKYKKRKTNADYCRESTAKKRKLAQANTQQQRIEKLSAAERQKQCRLRKKAENQQQASDAQANTQQQRVSRPEIEAEDDDDDYVFQVKRAPFVPGDTTSIDTEFKKRFYDNNSMNHAYVISL